MIERFDFCEGAVIRDNKTGLEWEAEASGPMSWDEAMAHAESLGDGWRLPTIEELETLLNRGRANPASSFPGMPSECFWTSTEYAGSASYAWYVYFYNGHVGFNDKTRTNLGRCVRSVKES